MGRSPTVTFQEVDAAMRQLLARGEQPTAQRLRSEIGDRGSPVLLQRLAADWYAQHGAAFAGRVDQLAAAIAAAATAPKPAVDVQAHLKAATQQALREVDQAHQQRMMELDARIAELDAREQGLQQRETALDQRAEALREFVEHHRQEAAAAQGRCVATEEASATLRTELAAAQALQTHYLAGLDAAGIERAQLKGEADRLRQAVGALEERARTLEQQRRQLEEQLLREVARVEEQTVAATTLSSIERQLGALREQFAAQTPGLQQDSSPR